MGGKNVLPMKELVGILEAMGYEHVRTYIQSGNVVFQSRKKVGWKDAAAIGKQVFAKKGFEPTVLLLSEAALQSAVEKNPLPTTDGKALHFFFLGALPKRPDWKRLVAAQSKSEAFELRGDVFYLHAPDGIGRSRLATQVEKALGVPATARNWNTVAKLVSLVAQD